MTNLDQRSRRDPVQQNSRSERASISCCAVFISGFAPAPPAHPTYTGHTRNRKTARPHKRDQAFTIKHFSSFRPLPKRCGRLCNPAASSTNAPAATASTYTGPIQNQKPARPPRTRSSLASSITCPTFTPSKTAQAVNVIRPPSARTYNWPLPASRAILPYFPPDHNAP
jgi:hypothetical protein